VSGIGAHAAGRGLGATAGWRPIASIFVA